MMYQLVRRNRRRQLAAGEEGEDQREDRGRRQTKSGPQTDAHRRSLQLTPSALVRIAEAPRTPLSDAPDRTDESISPSPRSNAETWLAKTTTPRTKRPRH